MQKSLPNYKIRLVKTILTKKFPSQIRIQKMELISLCKIAARILSAQPNVVHMNSLKKKIVVVGDIHGEIKDNMKHFFARRGYPHPKGDVKYCFLGDYVDRGDYSVFAFALIIGLIVEFGKEAVNKFVCLRGNHEGKQMSEAYGCQAECVKRYGEKDGKEIFSAFVGVYKMFPIAAVLNKKIFCVHAGISPRLKTISDLSKIERKNINLLKNNIPYTKETKLDPTEKLFLDILWSDPDEKKGGFSKSPRGVGYLYGKDVFTKFLKENDLSKMISSHRMVEGTHSLFDNTCITVFSSSNYGLSGNRGGVVEVIDGSVTGYTYYIDNSLTKRILTFWNMVGDLKSLKKEEVKDLHSVVGSMQRELNQDYKKLKSTLEEYKQQLV